MSDRGVRALERIADSLEVVARATEAEEKRAEERMEIMRKMGQSVEKGEAMIELDLGGVTKQ